MSALQHLTSASGVSWGPLPCHVGSGWQDWQDWQLASPSCRPYDLPSLQCWHYTRQLIDANQSPLCCSAALQCGWLRVPREVEVQGLDFAQGLPGRNFSKYDSAVYMLHQTMLPSVSQRPERSNPRPSLQLMRTSRHAQQAPGQLAQVSVQPPFASAEELHCDSAQQASVQTRSEKSLKLTEDSVGKNEE